VEIIQAVLLLVLMSALLIIVLAALKNVPRHKKGFYRFTAIGKNSDFEGPLK